MSAKLKVTTSKAAALVILLGGGLLAWNIYDDYRSVLSKEFSALKTQARLAESQIAGLLRGVDVGLQALVADQQATPSIPPQIISQRQLTVLKQFPEARIIFSTNSSGNIVTAESIEGSQDLDVLRKFNVSQRDYFVFHEQSDKSDLYKYHISRPFKAVTNKQIVTISRAIRDAHDEFRGVVVVTLLLRVFDESLQELLDNKIIDAAAVHNRAGDILYRLPDPEIYIGKNIASGAAFQKYLQSTDNITLYLGVTATDNVKRIVVFGKVGDTGLDVAISSQYDRIMVEWRRRIVLKLLVFIVFAALSVALFKEYGRRQIAREAVHKASLYARSLIEASLDPLVTISPDGKITDVNLATERATGVSRELLIGSDFFTYFTEPENARAGYQKAFAEGQVTDYPLAIRHVSGRVTDVLYNAAVYRNAEGAVDGVFAAARDITERKAISEKLLAVNSELEQFAYVASHDLRQPLRMVTSYLGIIEKNVGPQLNDDLKKYLGFVVEGAKRMDRLIVALLDYSRTGKYGESILVPLGEAIADALQNLAVAIRESGAKVSVTEKMPVVFGDKTDLMRVFQNLISNAIIYRSPDRPCQIEIGWSRQTDDYLVWVKDNGIGIEPEQHARVFLIFQRLVPKNGPDGSGIGLAVCKKIVEQQGGKIWIESEVGKGSAFFLTFPVPPTSPEAGH